MLLEGDVVEEIKKLKEQDGPELQVYGSGNFIQTLLKNDLVDEAKRLKRDRTDFQLEFKSLKENV